MPADLVSDSRPSAAAMRKLGAYRNGQEIYGETTPAEHWYCVMAGAARKCALLSDGRRRIVDFLLPGDYFGFRTGNLHLFAAEAIVNGTIVARYPRLGLESAADADPRLSRQLREIAFASVWRSQARLLTLGRVTAIEKVGSFLVEMAHRSEPVQQAVSLPMSRYDIADYLAISVETVSRSFSELSRRGAIRLLDKHRRRIVNHDLLETGLG